MAAGTSRAQPLKRADLWAACGALVMAGAAVLVGVAPQVGINRDRIVTIDGRPVFPIGFSKGPPVDSVTPQGNDAYAELAALGAVFHRCGPPAGQWGPAAEADLDATLDRSARAGLRCAIFVPDLTTPAASDAGTIAELRRVIGKYKNHPGLGYWKGADEPAWGGAPVDRVQRFYDIVHELDPNHPVWITQAPRNTLDELRSYVRAHDIVATDIYPIGYPPGTHSHLSNKSISVVGDYAARMRALVENRQPFWMVLQICWSGVAGAGKTLRFPTFPDERYMAYQAVINGARGLAFFGGNVAACLNSRDAERGWNWTFYRNVLKPVLDEFSPGSPLYPALVAPDSSLPLRVDGADAVEVLVRVAGRHLFVLAAKREGSTVEVRISGLLSTVRRGEVLFEAPRSVRVSDGSFTDWFGPNEVHVYRFDVSEDRERLIDWFSRPV